MYLIAIGYLEVFILIGILFFGSILLGLLILIQRKTKLHRQKKKTKIQSLIAERFVFHNDVKIRLKPKILIENFFDLSQKFKVSKDSLDEIYEYLYKKKYIQKLASNLHSRSEYKRAEAIAYLSIFKNNKVKKIFCEQLSIEEKDYIKILIINGLKYDIDAEVVRYIITSLLGSKRNYQKRVIKILAKYINQSEHDLSLQLNSPLLEVREAFVEIAQEIYHPNFSEPLYKNLKEIERYYVLGDIQVFKNANKPRIDRLYYQTLTALSKYYSLDLADSKYLRHIDNEVVKVAVDSLTKKATLETVKYLLTYASKTKRDYILSEGIINICERNKTLYKEIYTIFLTSKNDIVKQLIAGVLSKKMDYFIITIKDDNELNNLVSFMIKSRYSINIINWLNYNNNVEIENRILHIITPIAKENFEFYLELNNYLKRELFNKMGFTFSATPKMDRPTTNPEVQKTRWLTTFLLVSLMSIPIIFIFINFGFIQHNSILDILTKYIIDINKLFIVYYLVVNFLYLFFAFISLEEYNNQSRLWNIKNEDFLYEDGVMSAISILVPAYNEELSIVDSVRSLLSLKYPLYEVIVVNDGSKDQTLQKLIDAFELKRVDYVLDKSILTMPIKAVYQNAFYSTLRVIDKENGGKADSLNVGINFSQYDYVCGIDADSIIESDALLRMMSTTLDNDEINLALGGSIVPVNETEVSYGVIEKYNMPKSILAKLQTIEYIRAFNIGRLGFSKLKCFLIVSGAFGLFEKRMLKEIGGYLTASNMRKDTVGEDMELVVRITRKAFERGLNHRIQYVPMARCYTEVPEERKSLLSQRNRWQKGLIDTLSFHRKMIFNKKYGTSGTIALPYYFLFEMLGPVLEIQIYITIIFGAIFGIFDGVLLLLLFAVSVVLGLFVTLISIYIQEKYTKPFSFKNTMKLILYSFLENFGWRQFISLYRSFGYFSSFKTNHSWGRMKRKGFNKSDK